MKLLLIACIVFLLLTGTLVSCLTAQERPKQEAGSLFDKAQRESGDRVKQVEDFCTAAQMEPKNKKYQDTCNSYRSGLQQDDTAALAIALSAYKNHDLNSAETQARLISSYDPKLSGSARYLLERIHDDRLVTQVQAAWNKGDFQSVLSQAQ
jgi:hypothetical protein